MIVGIFLASANHPHYEIMLKSFASGVQAHGDKVFVETTPNYRECDVAVIFGSWKDRAVRHHKAKNLIIEKHYRQAKKPFLVMETPLLGRKIEVEYQWYRIGINHYLNNLGDFNNRNMDGNRWELLRNVLGLTVVPYRAEGDHITVALQLPGDASLLGTDITEWAVDTVAELRKYTNRPIRIRPHKLVREYRMDLINTCLEQHKDVYYYSPEESMQRDDLVNCWATVSYTSGYSVDSLLAGIPTFAMHQGNLTYEVANHSLSQIEAPQMLDRTQWLNNLAYAQWSIPEMQQGLPWAHLRPKLCQYR